MAKQNEKGHRKFLESLRKLIEKIKLLDPSRYVPPNTDLIVAALEAIYAAGLQLLDDVSAGRAKWRTTAQDKSTFVESLRVMGADAVMSFAALDGVSKERIEQARTHTRKMQGRRKKAAPIDNPTTPENESDASISAAQTSHTQIVGHFIALTDFLEAQPEYKLVTGKNEISNLQNAAAAGQSKINATIADLAAYDDQQNDRDKVFYDNDDAISERARRIKNYVGGEWGRNSPEFIEINAIDFEKP